MRRVHAALHHRVPHIRTVCSSACSSMPLLTSPTNEHLRLLHRLHSRKHRERTGMMLLEGRRLVSDALDAGMRPEFAVFADPLDGAQLPLATALAAAMPAGSVMRAPKRFVARVSDTRTPQGVLAALKQASRPLPSAPTLVLGCDGVSDPGNLGTLLRSAAGAGAQSALLLPGCCDAWGLKALRAGMGAQLRLPTRAVGSWDECRAMLDGW